MNENQLFAKILELMSQFSQKWVFAMKDIVSNLIAGAMILIHHPFRLNDFISVGGFEGTVIDINLRYTTIQNGDRKILIPNPTLVKKEIALMNPESNNN